MAHPYVSVCASVSADVLLAEDTTKNSLAIAQSAQAEVQRVLAAVPLHDDAKEEEEYAGSDIDDTSKEAGKQLRRLIARARQRITTVSNMHDAGGVAMRKAGQEAVVVNAAIQALNKWPDVPSSSSSSSSSSSQAQALAQGNRYAAWSQLKDVSMEIERMLEAYAAKCAALSGRVHQITQRQTALRTRLQAVIIAGLVKAQEEADKEEAGEEEDDEEEAGEEEPDEEEADEDDQEPEEEDEDEEQEEEDEEPEEQEEQEEGAKKDKPLAVL